MPRLKDILQQQRKMNFVGRKTELDFFDNLLQEKNNSIHLLYIQGPGGQGKTTLLKRFADLCNESSIPCIQVDCRYTEPQPENFKKAFESAVTFSGSKKNVIEKIEAQKGKVILLIDTYEKIKPLDEWLRTDFLPELPGNVITVIASRLPLSINWKADPGWQSLTKTFLLKELSDEESGHFLSRRNISKDQVKRIVDYTHGNALALSVVADMFDQRGNSRFDLLESPDVMKTLLEQFVQEVPSPAHKAALELCSLVYVTTEKLIEEVLNPQMANELFNWLTTLTIIERGPTGIYLHDIVRDAIATELHWRNPEWYKHLHSKTQNFFSARVLKSNGQKQRDLIFNLIYLHRMNAAVKHFFEFQETGSSWQDKLKEDDVPHLIEMVRKYEGNQAAGIFSKWIGHDSSGIWVFRDAEKTPAGFVLRIDMEKIKTKTHDEAINALLVQKKQLKIEEGKLFSVFRQWMGRDTYQTVSGIQSAIFLGIIQWYFTPHLAVSMMNCAHPGFWQQMLNYADLKHIIELDYESNGQQYGWYMHDWRKRTPVAWLELMYKKEVNDELTETEELPLITELTEQDFTDAVQDALKQYKNPKKLIGNPLLKSKFIKGTNGNKSSDIDKALDLADKISSVISSLENSPKDETLHRVLHRTFVNPVGGQEQTADFLYMSFSTYRRTVRKAVERVADLLWIEEKTL